MEHQLTLTDVELWTVKTALILRRDTAHKDAQSGVEGVAKYWTEQMLKADRAYWEVMRQTTGS